ncbi:MAG TPA: hypothetical protein PK014_03980 [Thermoanaerobaculia bacterium]|nr:hypothetical protein [Thermoanaerobaculia bacterium]HUM29215.1 hypothetical protein [Thermoanaerobaculia bacterium]HXK67826.1 hypothetical protein [Thermoanaerobaculia bacterium]
MVKRFPFLLIVVVLFSFSCNKKEQPSQNKPDEVVTRTLNFTDGSLDRLVGTVIEYIYEYAKHNPEENLVSFRIIINRDFLEGKLDRTFMEDPTLCTITEQDLESARSYEFLWNMLHDASVRERLKAILVSDGDPEIVKVLQEYPRELMESVTGSSENPG